MISKHRMSLFNMEWGVQLGFSDPVFKARYGKQFVTDEHSEFSHDPTKFDQKIAAGDVKLQHKMLMHGNGVDQGNPSIT